MTPKSPKRLILFAHYDAEDRVQADVLFHLRALKAVGEVVFVTTSQLDAVSASLVKAEGCQFLAKENRGYDFGMWQAALQRVSLKPYDEVVLTNSSVVGPIAPLQPVLASMDADFWSLTDNYELCYHLQSFFWVVRRPLFSTLSTFLASVLPYQTKRQVILSYELGLTVFFVESGAQPAAFASAKAMSNRMSPSGLSPQALGNLMIRAPAELLSAGVPYIKREVLRDNPGAVDLQPLYQALTRAGLNVDAV